MIARLLISSSPNARVSVIEEELKKNDLTRKHPDILYFEQGDKLGVAEARKIKEHFSLKPYSAKGRGVVIEDGGGFTIEAQNALLKTLEELPQEAILILGAKSDANLLPTILSRCQITNLQETNPAGSTHSTRGVESEDIEQLLNSSNEERFRYIEKLKDKEEFLVAMLQYFHQDIVRYKDFLAKLLQAEDWAKHNVNIRAILEYLMLVMPKME